MKKFVRVMALLLCLLALTGCGKEKKIEQPEESELQVLKTRQLPAVSREETLGMLNHRLANRALLVGEQLYTLDYDREYAPVLMRYRLSDDMLTEATELALDCVPQWLCQWEDRLYYVNVRAGYAIESIGLADTERSLVREGPCHSLLIRDGLLYFCDGEDRLCSLQIDGSGEQVLLENCDCPWLWGDAVLYRNTADGGRLHLVWPQEESDVALTGPSAWGGVVQGSRLWYVEGNSLCSLSLDSLERTRESLPATIDPPELLMTGTQLWLRGVSDRNGPSQWTARSSAPEESLSYSDSTGYRLCDYLGDKIRVDTLYFPDGRVRCFLLVDALGMETPFIAGRS